MTHQTQAAAAAKPEWMLDEIVAQLTRQEDFWGGDSIGFSFPGAQPAPGYGSERIGFSSFEVAQESAARLALQAWADVIATPLVETTGWNKGITLANTTSGPDVAWTYFPGDGGDVWISPDYEQNFDLGAGGYGLHVLVHEIGHALGLDHPGDYDGSGGYKKDAIYQQDTRQYTVMSYFEADRSGADHWSAARDDYSYAPMPLLHDIAAAQEVYGANMETRSGDTVYGFNSTAGDLYDFALYPDPVLALWDAGGTDTLDCSGYADYQIIELSQGGFSDIGGLVGNVAVAFGAEIENAIGGRAGDAIYGNTLANRLAGLGGADYVFGFQGSDSLLGGNGRDRLNGGMGADALSGGKGGDLLKGETGADRLSGGAGNDRLDGGRDGDALSGGSGSDVFLWHAAGGLDVIADGGGKADTLLLADLASTEGLSWSQEGDDVLLRLDGTVFVRLLGHALPGDHVEWLELSGGDRHPLDIDSLPDWPG